MHGRKPGQLELSFSVEIYILPLYTDPGIAQGYIPVLTNTQGHPAAVDPCRVIPPALHQVAHSHTYLHLLVITSIPVGPNFWLFVDSRRPQLLVNRRFPVDFRRINTRQVTSSLNNGIPRLDQNMGVPSSPMIDSMHTNEWMQDEHDERDSKKINTVTGSHFIHAHLAQSHAKSQADWRSQQMPIV
jgi:hypothetical protein